MSETILYVGFFGDPRCSASGQRVLNIARILRGAGYDIIFCSAGYLVDFEFEGFSFISARTGAVDIPVLSTVREYWNLLTADDVCTCIDRIVQSKASISKIIGYNCSAPLQRHLLRLKQKSGIKVFGDVTEWYETHRNDGLGNYLRAKSVDKRIRRSDEKLNGIIAISKYLFEYYSSKKVPCIWIPPVFDYTKMEDVEFDSHSDEALRIVYTGFPASGKDDLNGLIDAVCEVNDRAGTSLRLDILGPSLEYVNSLNPAYTKARLEGFGVYAHGKCDHQVAKSYQNQADLCFLIRENKRYAKAGFSTKFAECMSSGVLMCCNAVGGADELIEDGVNGFLVPTGKSKDIESVLERALNLEPDELLKMKVASRETALKRFSQALYAEDLTSFLGD